MILKWHLLHANSFSIYILNCFTCVMCSIDFVIGFDRDNQSYAVDTKNHPEIPIIKFHDSPGEFIHDMFFPCEVIISEGAPGDTAVGKSCELYVYNQGKPE